MVAQIRPRKSNRLAGRRGHLTNTRLVSKKLQPLGVAVLLASVAASAWAQAYTAINLGPAVGTLAGINNSGQVAEYSLYGSFVYSGGSVPTGLGTLPGATVCYAAGINNSGQVVGICHYPNNNFHAFLHSNASMIDLGNLPGASRTSGRNAQTPILRRGKMAIACPDLSEKMSRCPERIRTPEISTQQAWRPAPR
jgi:probable HAF family extracellular repeat protein